MGSCNRDPIAFVQPRILSCATIVAAMECPRLGVWRTEFTNARSHASWVQNHALAAFQSCHGPALPRASASNQSRNFTVADRRCPLRAAIK
jgi:hypothetical protein